MRWFLTAWVLSLEKLLTGAGFNAARRRKLLAKALMRRQRMKEPAEIRTQTSWWCLTPYAGPVMESVFIRVVVPRLFTCAVRHACVLPSNIVKWSWLILLPVPAGGISWVLPAGIYHVTWGLVFMVFLLVLCHLQHVSQWVKQNKIIKHRPWISSVVTFCSEE